MESLDLDSIDFLEKQFLDETTYQRDLVSNLNIPNLIDVNLAFNENERDVLFNLNNSLSKLVYIEAFLHNFKYNQVKQVKLI